MSTGLDERLSRLEATVEGITADISRLTNLVTKVTDSIGERSKTNWATVAVWVGVLITIGSLVVAGITADLSRIERWGDRFIERFNDHVSDGHPERVIAKIAEVEGRISRYEARATVRHDELLRQAREAITKRTEFTQHQLDNLNERLTALERGNTAATANRFTRQNADVEFKAVNKRIDRLEQAVMPKLTQ